MLDGRIQQNFSMLSSRLQPAVDHKKLARKLKELEMSGLVDFGPDKAEWVLSSLQIKLHMMQSLSCPWFSQQSQCTLLALCSGLRCLGPRAASTW